MYPKALVSVHPYPILLYTLLVNLKPLFMTNDIVLGFLSGSLATEIVREIFRFLTLGHEFKKKLQKLTYERKLQKAENAIAYHSTWYERLNELKASYLAYINAIEDITFNNDKIQHILEINSSLLGELSHSKYLDINAFYLYFDIKDNESIFSEEDATAFIQTLKDIEKMEDRIKMVVKMAKQENITITQELQCLFDAYKLSRNFATGLKGLIVIIDKHLDSITATIKDLKEQMKKY